MTYDTHWGSTVCSITYVWGDRNYTRGPISNVEFLKNQHNKEASPHFYSGSNISLGGKVDREPDYINRDLQMKRYLSE